MTWLTRLENRLGNFLKTQFRTWAKLKNQGDLAEPKSQVGFFFLEGVAYFDQWNTSLKKKKDRAPSYFSLFPTHYHSPTVVRRLLHSHYWRDMLRKSLVWEFEACFDGFRKIFVKILVIMQRRVLTYKGVNWSRAIYLSTITQILWYNFGRHKRERFYFRFSCFALLMKI